MISHQTNTFKNINTSTFHPYNSKFYKNRPIINNPNDCYTGSTVGDKPTDTQQPENNSELLQHFYNNQAYPKANASRQYSQYAQYNEHVNLNNSDDETLLAMNTSATENDNGNNDEDDEDNLIDSNNNPNLNANSLTNQVLYRYLEFTLISDLI